MEVKVKSLSHVWFCNFMDYSLPGSTIHGIFQARILKWIAISFSRRSSQPRDWTWVSHIVGRRFTILPTREVHITDSTIGYNNWCQIQDYCRNFKQPSVQSLNRVWLFATPWTTACQTSLSNTNSQSLPKLMSTESVMPSNHLILLSPSLPAPNPSHHPDLFK